VDMELYGFSEEKIDLIRSAFHILKLPVLVRQWQHQHKRLFELTKAVLASDTEQRKITFHHSKQEP
jgi:hypothetical protein